MSDKSQKIAKLLLLAGGTAIGIFLIAKYHKNIANKLLRTRNVVLYEKLKLQRTRFEVEVINDIAECQQIIASLRE